MNPGGEPPPPVRPLPARQQAGGKRSSQIHRKLFLLLPLCSLAPLIPAMLLPVLFARHALLAALLGLTLVAAVAAAAHFVAKRILGAIGDQNRFAKKIVAGDYNAPPPAQNGAFNELTRTLIEMAAKFRHLSATTRAQQRELARSLAELEEKNQNLDLSEERLRRGHEELHRLRLELEERAKAMQRQQEEMQATNLRLVAAQEIVQQKADDLEKANRHKSEFIATMSHELRTPLNSILILSNILSENRSGCLREKDIELAETINTSGQSLLRLINEVLDISKIDAGKMPIIVEECDVHDLLADLDRMFREVAEGKKLRFIVECAPDLPATLHTDGHRLRQILINLLNNACKFTEQGEIRLEARRADARFFDAGNPPIPNALAFRVVDQGIGIAHDKRQAIFRAFQQAEGGISRKYGGTGLGLTICRRLAKLLGGFIHLESELEQGSVFTLILPESLDGYIGVDCAKEDERPYATVAETPPEDDRGQLEASSKTILNIEGDPISARLMRDSAHEHGFAYLWAASGEEGLKMARFHRPRAILLNIKPPDMSGVEALNRLQAEDDLAIIPVFFSITAQEASFSDTARRLGAEGVLLRPPTPTHIKAFFTRLRELMDETAPILGLISDGLPGQTGADFALPPSDVHVEKIVWPSGLTEKRYDCLLLLASAQPNALLPEIVERLAARDTAPPLLIFAEHGLNAATQTIIDANPRLPVRSASSLHDTLRLLAIFLHRGAFYPSATNGKARTTEARPTTPAIPASSWAGRVILLGDSDLRRAFKVSSDLENLGIHTMIGRSETECQAKLAEQSIDATLLDVDLPPFGGQAVCASIRADQRFAALPIFLTGSESDRAACLTRDATGFLVKPVQPEKLLELLSAEL
ncbi:MAG: response regulator [Desulfobulbaceae bacterium]|jgi:signal transduction histidine kinase/DNA-binding response OmpR family regulator|nr:response regulator [Desulfobulbaceae bacterium]